MLEGYKKNKSYPRIGRIKYLAEHKLSTKKISPKKIIKWFASSKPLSGYGKMILGETFLYDSCFFLQHPVDSYDAHAEH